MIEEHGAAILRGFDTAVADIGDQLYLCHPLLSFEGDSQLYVARRLNWKNDPKALAVVEASEASTLATLFPSTHTLRIPSGKAVVAVGTPFAQAATVAGVQLGGSEIKLSSIHNTECQILIGIATPEGFMQIKTRLIEKAQTTFDEEFRRDAACHRDRLSERGNAALLLLRRCGSCRDDDLAIRQLAGAQQNREFDLYRRLLIRFALELRTQENKLNERVQLHIDSEQEKWQQLIASTVSVLAYDQEPLTLVEAYRPGLTDEGERMPPPLYYAAKNGHVEAVRTLVDMGADVRRRAFWGRYMPLLHHAAIHGHPDVIRALVDLGADVNASATRGLTPLHVAPPHEEAIQVLVEIGADVEAEDLNGDTPRERALRNGNTEAADFLRRLGG